MGVKSHTVQWTLPSGERTGRRQPGDEAWRDVSWRQSQEEWVTDWMSREAEGRRGPKDGTQIPVSRADGGAASDSGTHRRHRSAERCCIALCTFGSWCLQGVSPG